MSGSIRIEDKLRAMSPYSWKGVRIGFSLIALWILALCFCLSLDFSQLNPVFIMLLILFMTHLYTGLFITVHDAMHGTVKPGSKFWNMLVGWLGGLLFAYNFLPILKRNHFLHHDHPKSDQDPDVYPKNYVIWYFLFWASYLRWYQILLMGITFNLLRIWIPDVNLILFWMLPAILSTIQLFTFGTYLPHRGEKSSPHYSGSQKKSHFWAFWTCFFFGYHWEHHQYPAVPWWRLWQLKE